MSWLKMTSEALYLMKGGTNEYLDEVKLKQLGTPDKEEFEFDVPKKWFDGNGAPRVIVVDVGSKERLKKAVSGFSSDTMFDSVMKRSDWNAAAPKSQFEVNDRPKHIVIHHTTGPQSSGGKEKAKQVVKSIQNTHMTTGEKWSDIGYNFLNMVDGVLVEGRSDSLAEAIRGNVVRGAHAGNGGNPSPGVANEGDFTTAIMNTAQWNSLVNMCAALCLSCDIKPENIKGHRDFLATKCPGEWLYSQLPRLQKEVAAKLAS